MKIGILTLPFNNNYGGYLQAYALMTVVKQMGHDVELIYRFHNKRPIYWRIRKAIVNILKILTGKKVSSIIPSLEKELRYNGQNMMLFVDKFIQPKSRPLYSSKQLTEYINNHYDAIVIGSDQVWRPDYGPGIQDFFLSDIKDDSLIRISYAASFGSDNPKYTDQEKIVCGKALQKFKAVSVRETSGINVIQKFGWKANDIHVALDPTILLSKQHYISILSSKPSASKGKIFTYILDQNENVKKNVHDISTTNNLPIYTFIEGGIHYTNNLPSIKDWLCGIRDASMVITDSYHGVVFSIIMNTDFRVIINKDRGADRFLSLLEMFGLKDRIINGNSQDSLGPVCWEQVNELIEKHKEKSLSFLKESLKYE